jgi:hypothetical protein
MKGGSSQWIIGAGLVVVVALAVPGWLGWHRPGAGAGHAGAAAQPAAHPPAGPASVSTSRTNTLWPDLPIDLDEAESNAARLVELPGRDPFQRATPLPPGPPPASPVSLLKLTAIWRQSGCRAAVINDRVVLEGEMFGAFRVERVEDDRVWLKGPEKSEAITFERGDRRAAATPAAAPAKGRVPPRTLAEATSGAAIRPGS